MTTRPDPRTDVVITDDLHYLGELAMKEMGFKPHSHQVAGHRVENGRAEFAVLHGKAGRVLKPLQDHHRGHTEHCFYKTVFQNEKFSELRKLVPEFHRCLNYNGTLYLELSDISYNFKEPCITDIKIGALLYAPEKMSTDWERIERKYPLAKHIGYQILGMKTYCPSIKSYAYHDKIYFRENISLDNYIANGLNLFFKCHNEVKKEIVLAIVGKLENILNWFLEQRSFVFYGSSLLIMYEGGSVESCIHGDSAQRLVENPRVDVRMIDFTHVLPNDTLDENYLFGLKNLIRDFHQLID